MSSSSSWRDRSVAARLRHWSAAVRQPKPAAAQRVGRHPADRRGPDISAVPTLRGAVEVDPRECALLVAGCQPGILESLPDADNLVLKINAAIDIVRLHSGHIVFTQMAFDDLDFRFTPTTNREFSPLAREGRFRNHTAESAIHPAVAVHPNDITVRTTRLGAFSTSDLDEQLTNLGVTTLIVSGAHTSGTVLSTVREAADRDYRLVILSDCCADPDTEIHQFLMARIFPRQAEITSAAELYLSLAADKAGKQRIVDVGQTSYAR
ncbi:cysteine hydrolase [Mycolicibacterium sp. OfavD-34-C]|uniref:cysteine hydrolase n=1 Tax=Mycolicibacterium sp. OfavD-34-C TaxID=2917746 RepID=UPI0027E18832|nr:cysteine hydrolase [Mycolicibacterium sp. OfavD-34-C]